jgi:hypothetical protein
MFDRKDFLSFLRHPDISKEIHVSSLASVFKLAGISYLYLFAGGFAITLVFLVPLEILNLYPSQKPVDISGFNLFKVAVLIPIIEELIFRLPLKFSKANITVSFSLLIFLVTRNVDLIFAFSVTFLFITFMALNMRREPDFKYGTKKMFGKYFHLVFYFQALLFGFLHLPNFQLDYGYFYLFPFFILFYVYMGFLCGYVRVRYSYGIYASILIHILMNSLSCIINF